MKTILKFIFILIIFFTGSINLNRGYAHQPAFESDLNLNESQNLRPVTPAEADFQDDEILNQDSSILWLAPTTPAEADFSDSI
jgi:hypothetical protein